MNNVEREALVKEILEQTNFFLIPKLEPNEVVIMYTSTLMAESTAQAVRDVVSKAFPNNKWIIFNMEDLEVEVVKEGILKELYKKFTRMLKGLDYEC
jgi:hypothetical protein